MNCPKCGYEQEERLECLKCGIVFSKYTALYRPDRLQGPEEAGGIQARAVPDEESDFGLMELRQALRDVSRRFGEIEFERAQRHQLRAEIRNLEQKLQEELSGLAARFDDAEKRHNELKSEPEGDPRQKADFEQLRGRVEALEAMPETLTRGLDALKAELAELKSRQPAADAGTAGALTALDAKCLERTRPLAKLAEEVARTELLCRSLESDVRCLQAVAEALPRQQAELKSDQLELFEKARQLDLRFDAFLGEIDRRLSETETGQKAAIGQNVQSILETLDNLRCSVASLAPGS